MDCQLRYCGEGSWQTGAKDWMVTGWEARQGRSRFHAAIEALGQACPCAAACRFTKLPRSHHGGCSYIGFVQFGAGESAPPARSNLPRLPNDFFAITNKNNTDKGLGPFGNGFGKRPLGSAVKTDFGRHELPAKRSVRGWRRQQLQFALVTRFQRE